MTRIPFDQYPVGPVSGLTSIRLDQYPTLTSIQFDQYATLTSIHFDQYASLTSIPKESCARPPRPQVMPGPAAANRTRLRGIRKNLFYIYLYIFIFMDRVSSFRTCCFAGGEREPGPAAREPLLRRRGATDYYYYYYYYIFSPGRRLGNRFFVGVVRLARITQTTCISCVAP